MNSAIAKTLIALVMVQGAALVQAQLPPASPCAVRAEQRPQLTLLAPQTGRLAPGETGCLGLVLQQGEFVRVAVQADQRYLRARILQAPQYRQVQATWAWSFFPSLPLAFEAPRAGWFVVELHVPTQAEFKEPVTFRAQLVERFSPRHQAARKADLRRDPRTAWLRRQAVPIRSIEPHDEDFSDLRFLRDDLCDVRMVLLGEGDHGVGSDFKAKTRLIKFLHQELGFDVLAFEAGIFSANEAWVALQTDAEPRDSFLKGMFGLLGRSEQVQPLIQYLHRAARTDKPLQVTGFDSQFSGTARGSLPARLREFLGHHSVTTSLTDERSPASRILAGVLDGRFARNRADLPTEAEQAAAVATLRATADEIVRAVDAREASFWSQVLRSTATQTGLLLDDLRHPDDPIAYRRGRDRQMAENLLWLANTYVPQRKIIVWAHTFHVMRNPGATTHGSVQGFTMGQGVWEVLGREAFSIALTSYGGTTHWLTLPDGFDQDVIPDQHPSFELEELMEAAGLDLAYLNLRKARASGQWLGGPFVASLLYLMPEQATWSDTVDAILFIRTQEPSRRVVETK